MKTTHHIEVPVYGREATSREQTRYCLGQEKFDMDHHWLTEFAGWPNIIFQDLAQIGTLSRIAAYDMRRLQVGLEKEYNNLNWLVRKLKLKPNPADRFK